MSSDQATSKESTTPPGVESNDPAAVPRSLLQRGAELKPLQRNTLIPLDFALAARAGRTPTDSVELARTIKAVSATRLRAMPTVGPKR